MSVKASSPFIESVINFDEWAPIGKNIAISSPLPLTIAKLNMLYINTKRPFDKPLVALKETNHSIISEDEEKLHVLYVLLDDITEEWKTSIPQIEKLFKLYIPRTDVETLTDTQILLHNQRYLTISKNEVEEKLSKQFNRCQQHLSDKSLIDSSYLEPAIQKFYSAVILIQINDFSHTDDSNRHAPRKLKAASASTQGDFRQTMEDCTLIKCLDVKQGKLTISVPLFAVFDGHGGKNCAEFLERNLPDYLASKLSGTLNEDEEEGYLALYNVLKLASLKLGRDFMEGKSGYDGGSTSLFAIVVNNNLWVANVGDSRAILVIDGVPIGLSEDADLSFPKYQKGAWRRGAEITTQFRIHGLGMARAIGHNELGTGVNPRATVVRYPLSSLPEGVHHLILATDGLWDVASSNDVAIFTKQLAGTGLNTEEIAHKIVERAIDAKTRDNISAVVVEIRQTAAMLSAADELQLRQ